MDVDIISPYVKGFRYGNHEIHENRFKNIWTPINFNLKKIFRSLQMFFLAFCHMYLETYALLSPNDLSGPSGFVPEDVTFPLLILPAPFPVMGLLFSLTCKE